MQETRHFDEERARPHRCARRRRRSTTATSPSPTCRRSSPTAPGSRRSAPGCPSSPRPVRARYECEFGLKPDAGAVARGRRASGAVLRGDGRRGAPSRRRRRTGSRRIWPGLVNERQQMPARGRDRITPGDVADLVRLVGDGTSPSAGAKQVLEEVVRDRRGRRRTRSSRSAGSDRSPTRAARADRRRA